MTIEDILSSTGNTKEIVVEISSIKRSDYSARTWYFSTQLRETDNTDTPPNTTMPGYLESGILGPLTQSLSEDLFSGLASIQPGTLKLIQTDVDPDNLSQLNDYIFSGQQMVVKIGLTSFTSYFDFKTYRTLTISVDPSVELTVNGIEATFPLASATDRLLKENLITERYLGIPHCLTYLTQNGYAGTAVVGPNLLSYSISTLIRESASQATNQVIISKSLSGTDRNWNIHIGSLTSGYSGQVRFNASFGGTQIAITSPESITDGEWHSVACGLLDKTTAYLMIDNVVIGTFTPSVSVDVQSTNVVVGSAGFTPIGSVCDARIYDRYIAPEEFAAMIATRFEPGDALHMWRFDDNLGSTVNDYGSGNLDLTISGTINTDWKWDFSDLGEPELAGNVYPILVGEVFNAKAQLTDANRNRFRANVDATDWHTTSPSSNTDLVVKSQGTVLTGGGTDYTAPANGGGGVFSTTSLEAEPVTFDLTKNSSGTSQAWLPVVGYNLINNRTSGIGVNTAQLTRLNFLCPWKAGWRTEAETNVAKALEDIYGNSGLAYLEDEFGDLFVDMLRGPVGYGPFGEPAVDFYGQSSLPFGDVADISGGGAGSCTLACFFKTSIVNASLTYISGSEFMLIAKPGIVTTNYALYLITSGADRGKLAFKIGGQTLLSPAGLVEPDVWYFCAAIFNDGTNTMTINLTKTAEGDTGGLLFEIASATNSNSPTPNTDDLYLGGSGGVTYSWGSIQYAQVWNTSNTLTSLQLQAQRISVPVGNESNLVFYAPANAGQGPVIDLMSTNGANLAFPQRWSPRFTVDLTETPSVKLTEFHHTDPAGEVVIQYSRNWFPMAQSDIDTGVSSNSALALKTEWKKVSSEDPVIKENYERHKKVILPSSLTTQDGAEKLHSFILGRFREGRWIGKLTFPPGLEISARACSLQIGDEIGVIAPIPSQLASGLSFRVIAVSPNLLNLSTTVVFWG